MTIATKNVQKPLLKELNEGSDLIIKPTYIYVYIMKIKLKNAQK